jgi:hypothetical protein
LSATGLSNAAAWREADRINEEAGHMEETRFGDAKTQNSA